MSERSRSVLLASVVPAVLLGGVFAVQAQNAGAPSATATRWSDPATWPNKKVPAAGEKVEIASGKEVILDVSTPALGGVTINGKLTFADNADLELTTEWVMIHGELAIGTEAKPHTRKATITLANNVKDEEMMGMGDRGIMLSGGTLNLHGDRTNTWTRLSATANAGATSIQVLDARGWRVGDEIVLASTDYDPRQAERRTITAISGNNITLDRKLDYMHFGKITFDVDERGEVGLLTRNIKIQASEDAEQSYQGGHIMAMVSSRMYVSGVELNRMGQHMELARYPIHWHLVGDAKGQYIRNASIHDTYNRCVTVHGTNDLRVENNVTYNIVGHCFFLEDGIEHGNEFVKNLAIQIKCHPTKECVPNNLAPNGEVGDRQANRQVSMSATDTLLPSDNTVAAYWITNPDNTFIDNVAAGSDENGFWFSLPEHPNGAFLDTDISRNTWPRATPLAGFRGNVAHSNYDGFMFDRNINVENVFGLAGPSYMPKDNATPDGKSVDALFENLTTYKNRNGGVWGRGERHVFRNLKSADNAIGYTSSTGSFGDDIYTSLVIDSLFVGETDNIGNPVTPEEKAYGRSLPKRLIPDYPIHAYEYYDYRHDVVNTTFVNFQDNKQRGAGALTWLLYTGAGVTTENTVTGAKFINAKPAYFPKIDPRFDSDNRNATAYRTLAIHDLDGSTTGIPDSYILFHDGENDSVATDDTCKIQPTWNAAVCAGDIGRIQFAAARGGATRGAGLALKDVAVRSAAPARAGGPAPGAAAGRGAGAPRAGGAGPGGRAGGPGGAAQPIVLSRNGKDFKLTTNATTVRAGTEIRVKTERAEVPISLVEMAKDSWVVFELPGFTTATSGKQQDSLDALRKATETSYFKAPDAVWVKLVIPTAPQGIGRDQFGPMDTQASIVVRR